MSAPIPEFVLPAGQKLIKVAKPTLGCSGCAFRYALSEKLHHADCMDQDGELRKRYGLESCVKGSGKGSNIFVLVPEEVAA